MCRLCLAKKQEKDDDKSIILDFHETMVSSTSYIQDSQQREKNQKPDFCVCNREVLRDSFCSDNQQMGGSRPMDVVGVSKYPSELEPIPIPITSESHSTALMQKFVTPKTFTNTDKKEKKKHPIIIVQHNYHDHSQENEDNYPRKLRSRGGVSNPFPLKLHDMLEKAMAEGHGDIISWQPHGRCFVVYKPQEFQNIVLPKYFKLKKLSSFQRQLNLYGFQRLTLGRDRGGYYHELFLRNKTFLARKMQRVQIKGTGVRARSNPDQEPNFWTMQWCRPKVNEGSDGITHKTLSTCNGSISREEKKSQSTSTIPILTPFQAIAKARSPDPMSSTHSILAPRSNYHVDAVGLYFPHRGIVTSRAEEGDRMLSFGGRMFHSYDPFQPLSFEENRNDFNNEIDSKALDSGIFAPFFDRA